MAPRRHDRAGASFATQVLAMPELARRKPKDMPISPRTGTMFGPTSEDRRRCSRGAVIPNRASNPSHFKSASSTWLHLARASC
jgi:hypothetical protein